MGDLFEPEGMSFPAICLWQPFAHLPLVDAKPWETRSKPYPAKYHGRRIVVCSTKAYTPRGLVTDALHSLCVATLGEGYPDRLPRGFALYSIVLKGCERTEDMVHRVPPELLASGDFSSGRFAWEWGEAEPLNPFPTQGGQGWFRVAILAGAFRCPSPPAESGARGSEPSCDDGNLPPADPLPLDMDAHSQMGEGSSSTSPSPLDAARHSSDASSQPSGKED